MNFLNCEGLVVDASGDKCNIRLDMNVCGDCKACSLLSKGKRENVIIEASNTISAEEGDMVVVEVQQNAITRINIVLFGIPVIAMLIGYFVTATVFGLAFGTDSQTPGVLGSVVFTMFSFIAIKRLSGNLTVTAKTLYFKNEVKEGLEGDITTAGNL